MDNDILLVFGAIIAGLAIPSVIGAFSAGNPPRTAAILFMVGGAMISWVVIQQPNTYTVENFPGVFSRVISGLLH